MRRTMSAPGRREMVKYTADRNPMAACRSRKPETCCSWSPPSLRLMATPNLPPAIGQRSPSGLNTSKPSGVTLKTNCVPTISPVIWPTIQTWPEKQSALWAQFGKLAEMKGDQATAQKYTTMAKEYAMGWIKQADDGDHFRLAFDQPNTWSSKYNLVWDKILGLNLFPDEAVKKEMAFYRKNVDPFGLALDGRPQRCRRPRWPAHGKAWSKTDWAFWTACLTGDPQDFEAITNPIYDYFSQTPRRVGLSDLYFTDRPTEANMHSRPVIGGIFIKMLYDPATWRKWNSRDTTKARGPWAPLPQSPKTAEVVSPASIAWKYTTTRPAENWNQREFDDSSWKDGKGGFGTAGTPGAHISTPLGTRPIFGSAARLQSQMKSSTICS